MSGQYNAEFITEDEDDFQITGLDKGILLSCSSLNLLTASETDELIMHLRRAKEHHEAATQGAEPGPRPVPVEEGVFGSLIGATTRGAVFGEDGDLLVIYGHGHAEEKVTDHTRNELGIDEDVDVSITEGWAVHRHDSSQPDDEAWSIRINQPEDAEHAFPATWAQPA